MAYEHLLVTSDFRPASRAAYAHAILLASRLGARVTVLHVDHAVRLGAETVETAKFLEAAQAHREAGTAEALGLFAAAGVPATVEVIPGSPRKAILAWMDENPVDLVVMTRHSGASGRGEWLVGTTCSRVVRMAKVPVSVVNCDDRNPDPDPITSRMDPTRPLNILAPVDFSESSQNGARAVANLAQSLNGTVRLLHGVPRAQMTPNLLPSEVMESFRADEETQLDAITARIHEVYFELVPAKGGVIAELCDRPSEAILAEAEAWSADLIVVPATGKGAIARLLLGSTSERLMERAHCPVMILPAPALERWS